jgi:hypothetical protein
VYGGSSTVGIGPLAEKQGLQNLYQMLQTQGNLDPRIMQSMQAANARATQQAMDAQRARASRGGFSRGGLSNALMNSISSQGANRAAGITYQNAADAYGRNQQNVGLMGQLVQQPNLGYANLNEQARIGQINQNNLRDAAAMSFIGSAIGGMGGGMK